MASQPKVLVVDDDVSVRVTIEYSHQKITNCISLKMGIQALIAAEIQPDIILLDVTMPGISGSEVCQRFANACPG